MVPPPRFHLVRYHGVLSSHATMRREVVPKPLPPPSHGDAQESARGQLELPLFAALAHGRPRAHERPRPAARKPWAWLLRHVFSIDVTTCPRCEGPMRWLESATTPDAIARLLAAHGLGPGPPRPRHPPRGQLALRFGAVAIHARSVPPRRSARLHSRFVKIAAIAASAALDEVTRSLSSLRPPSRSPRTSRFALASRGKSSIE